MIKTIIKKIIGQNNATRLKQYAKFIGDILYLQGHPRIAPAENKLLYRKYSQGNKHVFFGYYDIAQIDEEEKKILVHVVDKNADASRDKAELGYFLIETGEYIPFSSTEAWCWQQGARLRWHPLEKDTVLFNDLEDDQYITRVYDIAEHKQVGLIPRALYDVDNKMTFGLSLNFSRVQRLRPGYGYSKLPDSTVAFAAPDNDGIFYVNLLDNTEKLIVSLDELSATITDPQADQHYINHISIAPDGNKFMFFHIWTIKDNTGWKTRLYIYDLLSDKMKILEDCDRVSHYDWINNNEILVTCWDSNKNQYYCIYNVGTNEKRVLKQDHLNYDGHPSVMTDGTGFISDTYPLQHDIQTLFEYQWNDELYRPILNLYSDARLYGEKRCDLHPRLSKDEKYITVDTACENGCRQVMLVEDWN